MKNYSTPLYTVPQFQIGKCGLNHANLQLNLDNDLDIKKKIQLSVNIFHQ